MLVGMAFRTKLASAAAVAATAAIGGLASRPAQSPWYEQLRKPPYQPPRQAFPIVWPALYADIAVTSAATLDELEARGETAQR
jgi:tryptophan-rich sensory protein